MRPFALAAAFLALGTPGAAAEDPAPPPLPGASWLAVEAGGLPLTEADEVTLDFADAQIGGRSGCNRFMGGATLTALTPAAGVLTLGPIAGTRMACPGRGDQVEAAFLVALDRVDGWQIEADGSLTLTGAGAPLIRARRR